MLISIKLVGNKGELFNCFSINQLVDENIILNKNKSFSPLF